MLRYTDFSSLPSIPTAVTPARPDRSWREVLPVHPAAELCPPMSPAELRELGEDIQKNGQRFPVAIVNDPPLQLLLDGCNRLDAMEAVGIAVIEDGELSATVERVVFDRDEIDPYDYVLSVNVRRRHLTAEQKREVLANLKALPEKSDRQIAEMVKADHKTAGAVRVKLEARGEIPHVSTRTDTKGRKQPVKRSDLPAVCRAEKLGAATIDKLKGTSLASARKQDKLLLLNRGAEEGELKPIVRQLVDDAVAGKNVSANAIYMNYGAPLPRDDDIGSERADECERPRPSESRSSAAIAKAAWDSAAFLNGITDSPDEIRRKLARLEELEIENVGLRSKVEELKAELAKRAPIDGDGFLDRTREVAPSN